MKMNKINIQIYKNVNNYKIKNVINKINLKQQLWFNCKYFK